MRIAAILTCFNRKEKTMHCLASLFEILPNCEVYITNDGCTDGTPEAIAEKYTKVKIINGTGNLFWSRGMYTAWKEAVKDGYDYYLWLNDDIKLYHFFYEELIKVESVNNNHCIVTGIIEDFEKTKILYGGCDENKHLILPGHQDEMVKYMNGNVVLIPKSVVDEIGIIDPVLHHDLGDVDYGLTACQHNIGVFCTAIPVAAGYENNYCRIRKWNTTITNRFKKLYSPLGSNPTINFYFRKKHFGIAKAIIFWIYQYAINIMSDGMVTLLWGDRYKDE